MRSLFIILLAANLLMFGMGQGWFGSVNVEPGRQPGMMSAQLNPDAVSLGVARIQGR